MKILGLWFWLTSDTNSNEVLLDLPCSNQANISNLIRLKKIHVWKAYLILDIVKQDKCLKYNGSSIILCPTHYNIQQFTVSSKIQCPHLLLIYICSTFPCWHAAVVSCFTLHRLYFALSWLFLQMLSQSVIIWYDWWFHLILISFEPLHWCNS